MQLILASYDLYLGNYFTLNVTKRYLFLHDSTSQAEGQEISEMRQSYDTAFEGLKAEIEAEQKKVADLEQTYAAVGDKLKVYRIPT